MVGHGVRQSVPRNKAKDYQAVAENFTRGAELARTYEYWNAAGLLIIHSAIAYSDAVTIKVGGVKSHGEDHMAVMGLLKDTVVLDDLGIKALNHLRRMIEQKNLVSYSGEIYQRKDVEELWKHLDRFRSWAVQIMAS